MNRQMRRLAQKQKQHPNQTMPQQQPMAAFQKIQEELEEISIEGSAGGGVVKATVSGKQTLQSIYISPDVLTDVEMLQDLIVAAVNDALNKSQDMASQKLTEITGGLDIPGLG